ncbi:ankyrin repeat domain-containing protein [Polynucleobacter paneuropaeus]|uniref:Ankyrin repeat domain-containing protein n=1 Tax=Polynucleobacter paneuropaeus TaxID=2527775 RepID=A0A9Q2WHC7_9BURK|nr:ankyrin repeat domain-containing protein [Polynucleobacter paneuropaeus]
MNIRLKLFYALIALSFCLVGAANSQTPTQIADFTKAAKFDDLSEVKDLVKAGVNVNTTDPYGDPMLVLAVKEKSLKVFDYLLLSPEINVNKANSYGETPLMMASINGDLEMVKTLVESKKATVNKSGWNPLLYACSKGRLDVAKYLVQHGSDVNSVSPNGSTPLMMAAMSGNEYVVKYLLDQGADLRMRNSLGYSAIDMAAQYDHPWIEEGLISRWLKLYKEPYPGRSRT